MTSPALAPAESADRPAPRAALQIQSVARALNLVELLALAGRPLALSEVSAHAGLKLSTCHHLLGTLVARGWARHDRRSRDYALGPRLAELPGSRVAAHELVPLALPAVRALNEACGEAAHVAVMQGYELVTLLKLDSSHAVRVDTGGLGKSNAAHATATGKALLAHWRREQVDQFIERMTLRRFTERTIIEAAQLHSHLEDVRRLGIAEDVEEFQPGVHCIGAPVAGADGSVVAAVSCSLPLMRAGRRNATRVRELVRDCARSISHQFGHRPDAHPV